MDYYLFMQIKPNCFCKTGKFYAVFAMERSCLPRSMRVELKQQTVANVTEMRF